VVWIRARAAGAGVTGDDLAKAHRALRGYFDYLASGDGLAELRRALEDGKGSPWAEALRMDPLLPGPETRASWAWVATFDPVPTIEKLRIPVLLFFGGRDDQLPTELSLQRWTAALGRSEARVTVRFFPEAGHGMTLGAHDASHHRKQQFAVGYFDMLTAWIHAVASPANSRP
jgi:pimeloyl-ACP methyl ester carboxylesterase